MAVTCLFTSRGRNNSLKKVRPELKQKTQEGKIFLGAHLSRKFCLLGLADYVYILLHKGRKFLKSLETFLFLSSSGVVCR